jgi:DNA-directed RNA polymerase specialized sigma24 family protein
MSDAGSVTIWIAQLQAGDAAAAGRLWEGYNRRLVALARKRLRGRLRGGTDEEGVALSGFASFCRAAERNQFPRLDDRDDLWQLLVLLTARKASRRIRDELTLKHCGGIQHVEDGPVTLADVIGREPTPEFAAQVAEVCRVLLDRLEASLRDVAVAKMEGHTNAEIAVRLDVSERTVERSLAFIRGRWKRKAHA